MYSLILAWGIFQIRLILKAFICPDLSRSLYDGTEAKSFTVAGQNQTVGFKLLGRSISSDSYALFAVNGKDTLSFDVGHVDGTGTALLDLAIFLDDQYVKTYDITATQGIKHIDIDLDGASVVKLQFVGEAGYFTFSSA